MPSGLESFGQELLSARDSFGTDVRPVTSLPLEQTPLSSSSADPAPTEFLSGVGSFEHDMGAVGASDQGQTVLLSGACHPESADMQNSYTQQRQTQLSLSGQSEPPQQWGRPHNFFLRGAPPPLQGMSSEEYQSHEFN